MQNCKAEVKAKSIMLAPTDLWGLGDLSRHFEKWRNRHHSFYDGGFNKNFLVDVEELESPTFRTSSDRDNTDILALYDPHKG